MSYYSSNEEVRDGEMLKTFFISDPRFTYQKLVASGAFGSAHHVRYNDPNNPGLKEFVVKLAFDTPGAVDAMVRERDYLQKLRGAIHLAQLLTIENNPLDNDPNHRARQWVILDWIPNGTLMNFMSRAELFGISQFPNRLLWRFFFCMLRACCGMAWPKQRVDNLLEDEAPVPGVPPGNIEHDDLHRGNVLLGDFLPNVEHRITPILKVIDFGLANEYTWPGEPPIAVPNNLFDIGRLMVFLITMDQYARVEKHDNYEPTMFNYNGRQVQTQARHILLHAGPGLPFPWLDELLRQAIAICLATNPEERPTIDTLFHWTTHAIHHRDQAFYDSEAESDDAIRRLCEYILFNPLPPPPPEGLPGEVNNPIVLT